MILHTRMSKPILVAGTNVPTTLLMLHKANFVRCHKQKPAIISVKKGYQL